MYSYEDRTRAIELYIRYDLCAADRGVQYASKKYRRILAFLVSNKV